MKTATIGLLSSLLAGAVRLFREARRADAAYADYVQSIQDRQAADATVDSLQAALAQSLQSLDSARQTEIAAMDTYSQVSTAVHGKVAVLVQ